VVKGRATDRGTPCAPAWTKEWVALVNPDRKRTRPAHLWRARYGRFPLPAVLFAAALRQARWFGRCGFCRLLLQGPEPGAHSLAAQGRRRATESARLTYW